MVKLVALACFPPDASAWHAVYRSGYIVLLSSKSMSPLCGWRMDLCGGTAGMIGRGDVQAE